MHAKILTVFLLTLSFNSIANISITTVNQTSDELRIKNLSTNEYYTWVYQTILDPVNHNTLDSLVQRFGLGFNDKNIPKITLH